MKRTWQAGFTLVEIMIVVAIIALLAAIAIPNVLRGRTTASETAAIGNMRALASSLEMFRSVNAGYPTLATWQAQMYGADCLAATAPVPDFGPPSFCVALTASTVQGYNWTYTGGAAAPTFANTYGVLANPLTLGTTGTRSFFVDQTGQPRHCLAGIPTMAGGPTWATVDLAPTAACT